MSNKSSIRRVDDSAGKLWTTADVAAFLQISASKFAYLRAQGLMAPPVATLGKSLRFHPNEVRSWVCAGCPPVDEWIAMKRRDPNLFDQCNF
jgi:predicted DNA-binding transcriptional regulator AlpA